MNKTKTNIFKKFYNWFLNVDIYKNQADFTNKQFYLFFSYKSLAIFLSLFLSFVFPVLSFLPVIVTCAVILSENSYHRLYYFALIIPFWFVFNYIYIVFGLTFCLCALKIFRDILNKKIYISKKLIIIVSVFFVYCVAVLKFSIPNYLFLFLKSRLSRFFAQLK